MSSARVDTVLEALVGHTERATVVVAVEVRAALQERNPVDTGWSRANWLMSTGAVSASSSPIGTPESVSPGAGDAGEAAVVAGYRFALGPIHVSNHVSYIRHIGLGDRGFVVDGIAAGLSRARSVLK